jgi:hypothetical protein
MPAQPAVRGHDAGFECVEHLLQNVSTCNDKQTVYRSGPHWNSTCCMHMSWIVTVALQICGLAMQALANVHNMQQSHPDFHITGLCVFRQGIVTSIGKPFFLPTGIKVHVQLPSQVLEQPFVDLFMMPGKGHSTCIPSRALAHCTLSNPRPCQPTTVFTSKL